MKQKQQRGNNKPQRKILFSYKLEVNFLLKYQKIINY